MEIRTADTDIVVILIGQFCDKRAKYPKDILKSEIAIQSRML